MSWKAVCAAALAASAMAALPARAQLAETVAAIVNDKVISSYDVRERASLLLVSAGLQPSPELVQRANAQALQDLIDEELQIQETGNDRYHIHVTDDEIDHRLDAIARQNNATKDAFVQQLAQAGVGIETLRHQIQADIAWNRLMSGLYSNRIHISEQEISDTQQRIAASSTQPRFLVSEIYLPANTPQEFADMSNGATRLIEQMQHGAPFPAVARQFSAAPSAAAGGDMGWLAQSELPPEIQAAVQQLQPGMVAPVRAADGIYIVAVREKQEGVAQGATQQVALKQITAPAARQLQLERLQRRITSCNGLDTAIAGIDGAQLADLGQATESDLSDTIKSRIANVQAGSASTVTVDAGQASLIVVCNRVTGGGGVPTRDEIEDRLYQQEMSMLSDRYLRNLHREANIQIR